MIDAEEDLMFLFMNALILALLVPTSNVALTSEGPTCRAHITGLNLVTIVELPTGLVVEGPWRITHEPEAVGAERIRFHATLDRVVETDALTGGRNVIPFPQPVRLAFEGESREDAVRRAARVWCVTVMKAQENQMLDHLDEPSQSLIAARSDRGATLNA
ncbi:MAG: hypothetical protein KFH98_04185 [Gemmatimonadetes bacterium]|nr:hypothetical protein [Gemmatimonadota bacterium]